MDWHSVLIVGHIIGTALGVGGATISDFLFFKAIKDKKISSTEFDFLKTVSKVVWLGFLILVFSGFGLLIFYRLNFGASEIIYRSGFLAKMTVALAIFFNGLLMHWKIFPLLEANLGKILNQSPDFLKKGRWVFCTGVISIISWYSALILGVWRNPTLSYFEIISVYLGLIFVGVLAANFIGKKLLKK